MCGIAGVFAYGTRAGTAAGASVARMCDRMACRGPDGAGQWATPDGRVVLGHRRLAIIDLSDAAAQPMRQCDEGLAIAFNGEIYNFRALRAALEGEGRRCRTASDTEVLLQLYAARGVEMLEALRGMFAFALWHGARRTLVLARDPLGIKPLYYADDGTTLRFASEVKALVHGGGVDAAPEPAGHAGFFLLGAVPEPYTLYRGVRALPAGSVLEVTDGGRPRVRRWADLAALVRDAERTPGEITATEVQERLREAVLDSVRSHLVADVPVGVFLSSGFDSTTVAALAAEGGAPLRTITLGFDEYRGGPEDETQLASLVASRLGADHRTTWMTRREFHDETDRLFDRMDQPTIDGVNTYFVARAAAQAGLRVALSGLGGDELLGGYPSFRDVPRLVGAVGHVPGARVLGSAWRRMSRPLVGGLFSPKLSGLLEYGGDFGGAFLLRRALFMPWELPAVMDPELARAGLEALRPREQMTEEVSRIDMPRLKVSALEAIWYMRSQLLRDADWAGMTHSVEIRVPLADWTLWKAVLPLIAAQPTLGKADMARAPRVPLPAALFSRRKTGFGVPVGEWFREAQRAAGARTGGGRNRRLRGWAREVYRRMTA